MALTIKEVDKRTRIGELIYVEVPPSTIGFSVAEKIALFEHKRIHLFT